MKRWDKGSEPVSYTHLRAHETPEHLVCHREIIKLDEVELRSPSFDRFPLFLYVHEMKVNELPD